VERTLVRFKRDDVQRGLIGEVISCLERRGFRLVAAKFIAVSKGLAEIHYANHKGKPLYNGLITYITSAPATLASVLFGVGWNLMGDGLTEAFDPTATFSERTIQNAVN
jgi:nucleoside diphosphate kinase